MKKNRIYEFKSPTLDWFYVIYTVWEMACKTNILE